METHGGAGAIFQAVYSHLACGVVFEKDPHKTDLLASQRPTWAVYEADCVKAIAAGAGRHLACNFFDIDPYGEPWSVIDALFGSDRPWPDRIAVVVNDGLRWKLQLSGAWNVKVLQSAVDRYGNKGVYENYLTVCREMMQNHAARQGYTIAGWHGYYCGDSQKMTHYAAILVKHTKRKGERRGK